MWKNRPIVIIALVVGAAHAAGIGWMGWVASPRQYQPSMERLVVKTVKLSPPKKQELQQSSKPKKKDAGQTEHVRAPAPPKKKEPVNERKTATAPQSKKEVAAKKTPQKPPSKPVEEVAANKPPQKSTPEPAQNSQRDRLIAQAKANLKNVNKTTQSLQEVGIIESMQVDSVETGGVEDQGYYAALASSLRRHLRLPELGEVKVLLRLHCQGTVVQVSIVGAENENNRRYVEKVLPTVVFPPFGKAFNHEQEHTFTLTLTNDL
jgi:flagellar biosynthesis GTPase FlhF